MSTIKSCYFTTSKGRKYTIVMTDRGNGKDVMYAMDTVVNQEGKRKTLKRAETLKLINS